MRWKLSAGELGRLSAVLCSDIEDHLEPDLVRSPHELPRFGDRPPEIAQLRREKVQASDSPNNS